MIKYQHFIIIFLFIFTFDTLHANKGRRKAPTRRASERALKPSEQLQTSTPARLTEVARPVTDMSVGTRENIEVIQGLVDRDANPNLENKNSNDILRTKQEIAQRIEDQASSGSLVASRYQRKLSDNPRYDIIEAVFDNEPEIVQLLINNGVDPNTEKKNLEIHYSALMVAVRNNNVKIVDILLDAGADVTLRNREGFTALHFVQDAEVARRLIEQGADINVRTSTIAGDLMPLHTVIVMSKIDVIRVLIEQGADVHARTSDKAVTPGVTPLHLARDAETVRLLIERGADVHVRDERGFTPLHMAENIEVADVLLEHKASVHAKTSEGITPLHIAWDADIARLLIDYGVDINARSDKNETPLHTAALRFKVDVVEFLINHDGVDVDAQNDKGETALQLAINFVTLTNDINNIAVVKTLIESGADVNTKDNRGRTPLDTADIVIFFNNNSEIKEALIAEGARRGGLRGVRDDFVTWVGSFFNTVPSQAR